MVYDIETRQKVKKVMEKLDLFFLFKVPPQYSCLSVDVLIDYLREEVSISSGSASRPLCIFLFTVSDFKIEVTGFRTVVERLCIFFSVSVTLGNKFFSSDLCYVTWMVSSVHLPNKTYEFLREPKCYREYLLL